MLFVNLSVVWAWGIDLSFDNNPPFLLKMNLLYEIPRYNTVLRYLVPRYIIQVLPWCHELQLPGRLPSPYLIKLDATTTALWRGWSHWSWFYRWLARCPDGYGARRMVVRTLDSLLIARKKSSAEPSNLNQTFLSAAQYRNKFWLSLWGGLLAWLNYNAEIPCGER